VSAPCLELAGELAEALRGHLAGDREAALARAGEIGGRALVSGVGLLEVIARHDRAIAEACADAPAAERQRIGLAAPALLRALLLPFESAVSAHRSGQEERRRLEQSLKRQKEALETANGELESFSYSISHDLRAPLRTIDGFSQVLLEDYGDRLDAQGRDFIEYLRSSAQRMARLIDDLLGLARVTRREIRTVRVDLSALARESLLRLRAGGPEREVEFIIEDGVHAEGDEALLTIVVSNLLDNAWKFTSKRERAHIEFGARSDPGGPSYFVRDDGAGFDMQYASKLFGVFQRLHRETEFPGTGIGLAAVQRILRRHGGGISAHGKLDGGATFTFTLPAPDAEGAPSDADRSAAPPRES
jgi:signal transduction histidine kinase